MYIFISYRHADSGVMVGRLYKSLIAKLGAQAVFRDHDNLPYGRSISAQVAEALDRATVVVVVIGPHWLALRNDQSVRRIDVPGDSVRVEIERALSRGIPVVPVLVGGAAMPAADELPESIRSLCDLKGGRIDDEPHTEEDIQRLTRFLMRGEARRHFSRRRLLATAAVVGSLGIAESVRRSLYGPPDIGESVQLLSNAVATLTTHLQSEVLRYRNVPAGRPGYDHTAVAQMVVALGDELPVGEREPLSEFFGSSKYFDHPSALHSPHAAGTCWVANCLVALGTDDAMLQASALCTDLLRTQKSDGGWSTFLEALDDHANNSTYATCWCVLTLRNFLGCSQVRDAVGVDLIQKAVQLGLGWLKRTRLPTELRWVNYPYAHQHASNSLDESSAARANESITGLAVYCLNVSQVAVEQQAYETYADVVAGQTPTPTLCGQTNYCVTVPGNTNPGIIDVFNHYVFPWSLAAVATIPNRPAHQWRTQVQQLGLKLNDLQFVRSAVERTWIAAETLIALKIFQKSMEDSGAV